MLNRLLTHRLVRILALVIGGYIILQTSRNIISLWSARNRVVQAQKRLQEVQKQKEKLEQEISQVDSSAFVEREARDKLGLVKEGEVILVLPQDEVNKLAQSLRDESTKLDQTSPELPNWQKWLKLFTD